MLTPTAAQWCVACTEMTHCGLCSDAHVCAAVLGWEQKAEVHAMKDRVEALAAQVEALSERVITGVPTHHQAEVINALARQALQHDQLRSEYALLSVQLQQSQDLAAQAMMVAMLCVVLCATVAVLCCAMAAPTPRRWCCRDASRA